MADTNEKKIKMSSKVFNFLWIIFFGLWATIGQVLYGVILCITIIGIPSGLAMFRTLDVIWHPFGRVVKLNFGSHPFLNVWWLIWGGFLVPLGYYFAGALFCITIIGIPIGLQIFKIAKAFWAPHGVELTVK